MSTKAGQPWPEEADLGQACQVTPGLGTRAHGIQGRLGDTVLELTVGARPLGQESRWAVLNRLVTCGTVEVAELKLLVETVMASGHEQV